MRSIATRILFLSFIFFISCDETIHPTLQSATPIYVVDAFINNKLDTQVIHLTLSQPYLQETLPPGVSGALVTITDNHGGSFVFDENPRVKGDYIWMPSAVGFGTTGFKYSLNITTGVENFVAEMTMGRVPKVDSITFAVSNFPGDGSDFYRGQFWGTDPVGTGDTYWIKAYKNGVLLNKPSEINLAYDASFTEGSGIDGETFIQPIRSGINPDDSNSSKRVSAYSPGDSVYVEINSLSPACFDYLNQVVTQTNRPGGFSELFATPLANVSTNISNTNPQGTVVMGFFNVAAVSGLGQKFILKP